MDVEPEEIAEFIETRSDLRSADTSMSEIPLIIGDDKYHGVEVVRDLLLVFVTDTSEDEHSIFERMEDAVKPLRRTLEKKGLDELVEHYEALIEPSVTTRLKIALVGEGGVGKTTTLHLLLGDTPPKQYVPTIALNLETVENIRFGNYSLVLWDFAGQERFRTLWRFYFHGADVIFLVCDSTLRNVIISKDILKLIRRDAPKVPVFALANKQDKPNAMKPEVVHKILGIPTYPMVAIDKERRDEMLRILMNAAAQYVGVVLPDLPASELLRFSDEAAERAAVVDLRGEDEEEEYETVEVIEEVYVDEDGHIIEDTDDYEIIEEVVEEVEIEPGEELDVEDIDVAPEEPAVPETSTDFVIVEEDETETAEEIVEEPPVSGDIPEPAYHSSTELVPVEEESEAASEDEATYEIIPIQEEEGEAEEQAEEPPTETPEEEFDVEVEDKGAPAEISVEVSDEAKEEVEEVPEPPSEEEMTDELRLVKDILSEKLDADDIIAEEIDRTAPDDLDIALDALKCEETVSPNGTETEAPDELREDELLDLDRILGLLDDKTTPPPDDTESAEKPESVDEDTLVELEEIIDPKESHD